MDFEPSVAELLLLHREKVAHLMDRIRGQDAGGTCIVDELFVLRYILSDEENAEKNILMTLEWRRQNREALLRSAAGDPPYSAEMAGFVKKGLCGWVNERYCINVIRAGHGNPRGLMRALTTEQCVANMLFQHEVLFAQMDARTRETGNLCKTITIIDLQGFSMKRFDRKFTQVNGETTYLNALHYPQLLKAVVIINLPATFRILHSFGKMFTSRSTLEKQRICPARTLKGSASDCPFLRKLGPNSVQAIPHFLGGTYPMPSTLRLSEDEMEEE